MSAHTHNLEIIITGKPKIVEGAMAEVMECEIFDSCLVASRLKTALDLIERFLVPQEYPDSMESSKQFFQNRLDLWMDGNNPEGVCFRPICRKPNKSLFQINFWPRQIKNLRLGHPHVIPHSNHSSKMLKSLVTLLQEEIKFILSKNPHPKVFFWKCFDSIDGVVFEFAMSYSPVEDPLEARDFFIHCAWADGLARIGR